MITIFEGCSTTIQKIPLQLAGRLPWNYVVYSFRDLANSGPLRLEGAQTLHLYSNFDGENHDLEEQYRKKIPGNEGMHLMVMDSRHILEELHEFRHHGWKTQSVLIADSSTDHEKLNLEHEHILIPFQSHLNVFACLQGHRYDLYGNHKMNHFNKVKMYD